jgi:LPS sulfotransferase NodH
VNTPLWQILTEVNAFYAAAIAAGATDNGKTGARVHGNNSAFTQDLHCARHCSRAGFDAEFRDYVLDVLA